jgi:hypothetical protein
VLITRTMLTFPYRVVEMPWICRRTFTLLIVGLLSLGAQSFGQKASPAASQPSTPTVANSPAKADWGNVVGKVVKFSADSERYRVSGWSKTEGNYAWTEGTSARLALPISADAGPLTLKMTLRGLIHPPTLLSQPVEIFVNGKKVADWKVADTAAFTAEVPAELTKSGGETLDLELRIPKATSPKSLGMNSDERILGVCGYSIEVTQS